VRRIVLRPAVVRPAPFRRVVLRLPVLRLPVLRVLVFRVFRPFDAAVFLGRPRRRGAAADVSAIFRGLPGRGFLAPAVSSVTCLAQRSFTKFPRVVLIVTISVAGSPHTSQTTIVLSAISTPRSSGCS
jgi:hypothetical protein